MKPSFLVRSEQIAGRVVSGEDLMSFTGMPTRAYQYNQKGAQLKFILPQEGWCVAGHVHPEEGAAPERSQAVDRLLSETGQTVLVKGEALVSGRAGLESAAGLCARDRHAQRHQDRLGEIVHPGTGEAALGVDCHFQSVTSTLPLA